MARRTTIEWTNRAEVLNAVERWPDIFAQEIQYSLRLIGELLRTKTVEVTPSGSGSSQWGHLANAISVSEPTVTPTGHRIEYGTPAGHGYAATIEYGRRPGSRRPPVMAIAEWVWHNRTTFNVKTEKEALRVAYPIAKIIGEKGFSSAPDGQGKGWSMFEKGQKMAMAQIHQLLADTRVRIVARINAL